MESMPKEITLASRVVKHYEGKKLTSYVCPAGYLTIGYGHLTKIQETITEEKAEEYLRDDLIIVYNQFMAYTDNKVLARLKVYQKAAIISFIFNLGIGNYKASTLKKCVDRGDTRGVVKELGKWRKGAGVVLQGLVKRRACEAKLYAEGILDFNAFNEAKYVYGAKPAKKTKLVGIPPKKAKKGFFSRFLRIR